MSLRRERSARSSARDIDDATMAVDPRSASACSVRASADGWLVTPPSWRFDIAIEADLIEEIARIVGFDAIPETDAAVRAVDAAR